MITVDAIPAAIAEQSVVVADLEGNKSSIEAVEGSKLKIYVETPTAPVWLNVEKSFVLSNLDESLTAARDKLKQLTDLQDLLNQTLSDALKVGK